MTARHGIGMDKLTGLLSHFSLHAGVFYTGNICGAHDFEADTLRGHIHLVRRGAARLSGIGDAVIDIVEPSILFLPRPVAHRLIAGTDEGADVVCGSVRFGVGGANPLSDSLPDVVLVELANLRGANALLDLMLEEAFTPHSGAQAALDRLCEVLMIRLLRYCIEQRLTAGGALAGLADLRLSKAMLAIHAEPARNWDVSDMAAVAGMSRARFATRFHAVTGATPAGYLLQWRLAAAKRLLRHGRGVQDVAAEVGYGSAGALSRAFLRQLGLTPSAWLKHALLA